LKIEWEIGSCETGGTHHFDAGDSKKERSGSGRTFALLLSKQVDGTVGAANSGRKRENGGRVLRGQVVVDLAGLVLPDQGFGSRVIDVEDRCGLREGRDTSRIEKPSCSTFRRNLSLVLIGILAYLERAPTFRLLRCCIAIKLI
jgi:hypothetical protein